VGCLRTGGIRTAGLFCLSAGYLKEEIATLQHLLFGNKKAE
jgi:hypothetical protein